jgi:hypothetical protein
MYRDSANALDEHDRAVGAILIGEALIDHCERAGSVIQNTSTERNERWRTLIGVHDTYPEIWRHLDRARGVLASRGANTATYDDIRPLARRAPTNAEGTRVDRGALDSARRAVEELKLAAPGADWLAIQRRTNGLVELPLSRAKNQRTALVAIATLFITVVAAWGVGMIPERKVNRREAMRRELSEVTLQRKVRIEAVRVELGLSCDVERARELTKLLVMDGRRPEARAFGFGYLGRCGDDSVVDNWSNAPDPKRAARP